MKRNFNTFKQNFIFRRGVEEIKNLWIFHKILHSNFIKKVTNTYPILNYKNFTCK